jgi:hypothetical protein
VVLLLDLNRKEHRITRPKACHTDVIGETPATRPTRTPFQSHMTGNATRSATTRIKMAAIMMAPIIVASLLIGFLTLMLFVVIVETTLWGIGGNLAFGVPSIARI